MDFRSIMAHSRLPGFHKLPPAERAALAGEQATLSEAEIGALIGGSALSLELADKLIENVIGVYGLPMGLAANFQINGRDVLIPMVIEEPSVVAGASFMAKLAREGGGFIAESTEPLMIGQLQVLQVDDLQEAARRVMEQKAELIAYVDSAESSLKSRGGGARDIDIRIFESSPIGP